MFCEGELAPVSNRVGSCVGVQRVSGSMAADSVGDSGNSTSEACKKPAGPVVAQGRTAGRGALGQPLNSSGRNQEGCGDALCETLAGQGVEQTVLVQDGWARSDPGPAGVSAGSSDCPLGPADGLGHRMGTGVRLPPACAFQPLPGPADPRWLLVARGTVRLGQA